MTGAGVDTWGGDGTQWGSTVAVQRCGLLRRQLDGAQTAEGGHRVRVGAGKLGLWWTGVQEATGRPVGALAAPRVVLGLSS